MVNLYGTVPTVRYRTGTKYFVLINVGDPPPFPNIKGQCNEMCELFVGLAVSQLWRKYPRPHLKNKGTV